MMLALNVVTTLCIGLLIGTEFAVSAFINPILRKLDSRAQASAIRLFAKRLGTAMPFWYAASLLLLIGQAILRRQQSGDALLIAASTIWAAVIVHTLLVLVPINNRMMKLDSDALSAEEQRAHTKWDNLHRLRVAALVAAMVCCLVAIGM
ncbi:MAG TPA: DUF1772 domain-containing protein [Candidatus Angelobacter sp.]|jgi:uncharacterized membrane protein